MSEIAHEIVEVARVGPDDVLVVRISPEMSEEFHDTLMNTFVEVGLIRRVILVASDGMEMAVVPRNDGGWVDEDADGRLR